MRSPRIDPEWARSQIEKYGADNPWVLINVFGKFPPSSINSLIGPEDVKASMEREPREDDYKFAQKRLGVDVARFGDDSTVIYPRQGLRAFPAIEMRNARSNEIAARVGAYKAQWGSELECVDGTGGYGSGVIDSLLQAGVAALEIHFNGKATDPRYFNKRSEMWFKMAEWVKRGGCLPDDKVLLKEITAPTYTIKNGKFYLEPKDQIKQRLGFSPDRADALALTFSVVEQPHRVSMIDQIKGIGNGIGKVISDWNPADDGRE
jgi:hypothetical protein